MVTVLILLMACLWQCSTHHYIVGSFIISWWFQQLSYTHHTHPHTSHTLTHTQPENVPLPDDDDDNGSVGTIYESIDNLVSQFDDAMRATAAAMGQIGQNMKSGGKKRKKKHNVLSRQTSFLTRGKTGSKSNFLSDKKSELERGDKYTGYLFKKTSSGSWKKRWCTLKGCVFGYYK